MRGHWVIRLPTWLGDTVMAVPTIRALARSGLDHLTLWGPEAHARLLIGAGLTGVSVLPYRRQRGLRAVGNVAAAATALARVRPSGVLLLPNAIESALIAALARVRRRVGYATDHRGFLLTDAVPPPDPLAPLHDADRYARLLEPLNVRAPGSEDVLLRVPPDARALAQEITGGRGPLLGLVPGAANGTARRWPAAAFAALARRMAAERGAVPVILGGGASDAEAAATIRAAVGDPCIDLTGRTDVAQLAAVLSICRAVVANDTGAAHLSAALGTPTLVLFGPTDPRRTRARGPHVRVASIGAFCQPCMLPDCPLDHRCMVGLPPEVVASALQPLWLVGHAAPRS